MSEDKTLTSMDRLFELDEYCKEYAYKNYTAKIDTHEQIAKYLKKKFKFTPLSEYECDYFVHTIGVYREEKEQKKIRARELAKKYRLAKKTGDFHGNG